nr:subtilisin-like protease SBT4.3 [Tanacetum cinerariifolium]
VFIAYMGHLPEDDQYSPAVHHSEMINQIIDPSFARKSLIRSYTRSFNGFAAYLSLEEAEKLTRLNGVLSVIPCKTLQLQTTRSWDFIGFPRRIDRRRAVE